MEHMIGIPSCTRTLNAREWDEMIDGDVLSRGSTTRILIMSVSRVVDIGSWLESMCPEFV